MVGDEAALLERQDAFTSALRPPPATRCSCGLAPSLVGHGDEKNTPQRASTRRNKCETKSSSRARHPRAALAAVASRLRG